MNVLTTPLAANLHSRYLDLQTRIEDKRVDLAAARDEEGAATVEYAGATLAALAMAVTLIALFRTGFVPKWMEAFIKAMLEKYLKV